MVELSSRLKTLCPKHEILEMKRLDYEVPWVMSRLWDLLLVRTRSCMAHELGRDERVKLLGLAVHTDS